MGNPSNEDINYISEIEFERGTSNVAFFSCNLPDDSLLSIIIQNELGKVCFEKQFSLEAGDNIVQLDLSSFSNGRYHAWIDLLGQTTIRNIHIENNHPKSNPWLKKIKSIFN